MPDKTITEERLLWRHEWTPKLFSFRLTRPQSYRFSAGQFARLGVVGADGKEFWRAYSMVSAPYDEFLEFFSIVVPDGKFTPILARLKVGDTVRLDHNVFGFLTLDRFPDGRDLWLLASGTGIAPFLSILQEAETWDRFKHVVLAYSARSGNELAYRDWLAALPEHPLIGRALTAERFRFIPAVTREPIDGALRTRLTEALTSGALEAAADLALSLEHSRLMVCGNPQMVDDLRALLKGRGFQLSRLAAPALLAFENFW